MAAVKVVITGGGGQLGRAFQFAVARQNLPVELFLFNRPELDVADSYLTLQALRTVQPNVVINCAGYTAVERAEAEPDAAAVGNVTGPANLANACKSIGARLVHFSTDYVFDGKKNAPYTETDAVHPLSVYGRTKWQGEEAIRQSECDYLILRTAWVFSPFGENFVTKMVRMAAEKPQLQVVNDQWGSPTYAVDLAAMVLQLVSQVHTRPWTSGLFHLTNAGRATWHDLAREAVSLSGLSTPVLPVRTNFFPSKVHRPAFSVMDCSLFEKTFGLSPRPWTEALQDCISQLKTL